MSDRRNPSADHDLLIQINTKLERALVDIRDLKDGTAARMATLEAKVDQLEEWKWREAGAIGVLLFLLSIALHYFLK